MAEVDAKQFEDAKFAADYFLSVPDENALNAKMVQDNLSINLLKVCQTLSKELKKAQGEELPESQRLRPEEKGSDPVTEHSAASLKKTSGTVAANNESKSSPQANASDTASPQPLQARNSSLNLGDKK